MSATPAGCAVVESRRFGLIYRLLLVLGMAAAGLFIVKWYPYFYKTAGASMTHSLGRSVILGKGVSVPAPSVATALGYARSYFNSVWQAWVLGILLAAAIEILLPRNWLARALGKASAKTSLLAGVLALPGMM